jgi:hypothetical protein
MRDSIIPLSQREQYKPSWFDTFLWWLSTAEKELLADCVVDRNRYRIIGTTVLGTWAFATLAWTYFWSTITTNWLVAILLGLFMGFIILTIDRALIKGINKFNKTKAAPLILRSILAITLGTFMAQPAVLYMFDKEVRLQASLDNGKRIKAKQAELDSLYQPQKNALQTEKQAYQTILVNKYNEVSNARESFVQEIDGTGGSGKVGIQNIAMAKKMEYEKLDQEHKKLTSDLQSKINTADSSIAAIDLAIKKENQAFAGLLNNGFLTRIEALNNLVKSNAALQWRYFLIVIILMLIELMPVLAKTLLPSGTYDEKVKLREEMEKEIAQSNQLKERDLKELYNQLAKENDEAFLRHFFEQTKEDREKQMREKLTKWNANSSGSFDGFWEQVKQDILTKQEN